MTNYKALQIIRTFSTEQLKEFEKFLQSPFHSTGRDLLPLFGYLKKYHPAYDNDKALKLEHIHDILSGKKQGKAVKSDLTRKLLSDLYKQAEKFITITLFIKNNEAYTLEKIRALNKLEIKDLFVKSVKDFRTYAENERKLSIENLFIDSEIYHEEYRAFLENEDFKSHFPPAIKSAELKLIAGIAEAYLQHAAHFTYRKNFNYDTSGSVTDKLPVLIEHDNFMDAVKKNYPDVYPFIEICRLVYMMFQNPGVSTYYFLLKKKLFGLIGKISHELAFTFLKYLEGYLILNSESGIDRTKERVSLSKDMLKFEIYTNKKDSEMSVRTFTSFLYTFLSGNDVKFAEEFLKKYNPRLKEKFRENLLNIGMAYIMLKKKKFSAGLGYLAKVKKEISYITHPINYLDIMLQYELQNFDETLYKVDAYEHYLRNNAQISELVRLHYLNFVKFVKRLIRCRTGLNIIDLSELKIEISATTPLFNPDWLNEKAEELKS